MSEEIAVVAIAEAKPSREAEVEATIRACIAASRQDTGCLLYTAHVDSTAPQRFVFIERWASRSALSAHEKEAHFLALARSFETLLAKPLQALILRELT
jgi:quinol monooxygenase YgiN